jgi:hypothetical protein
VRKLLSALTLAIAAYSCSNGALLASSTTFGLLGDPSQNYMFARADSRVGAMVSDPVGPYPGWLGSNALGNLYGFFCIDYGKTANWNASYQGQVYTVQDAIPGRTEQQLVEAAYLSDKLFWVGGSSASTNLYQGPISFAIWEIMDPTAGHVPVDPAAQVYLLDAQQAYASRMATAVDFPNTRIFVPDNPSIQEFMTLSPGVPEASTVSLVVGGLLLVVGRARMSRRRAPREPSSRGWTYAMVLDLSPYLWVCTAIQFRRSIGLRPRFPSTRALTSKIA